MTPMAVAERAGSAYAPPDGGGHGATTRGLPPGPGMPPLVQTLAWTLAPSWFMEHCMARVGETFTVTFFPSGLQFTMVADPAAVKDVFQAPPDVAPSAAANSPVRPIVGPSSVLVTIGPEHLRQRKLLLPPFHGERMREYEEVIVEETRRDLASWPLGRPMRLLPRSRAITLEVILTAVFGVGDARREPLRRAIQALMAPLNVVAVLRIALTRPTGERPDGRVGAALDALDGVLYEEIRSRRGAADLAEREDILSLLLQARDEEGSR